MSEAAASTQATATQTSRLMIGWWLLCATVAGVGTWFALTKIADHDVAYWLMASDRILGGARLYRDLIELNPPVNYAISMVPVLIARLLSVDAIATYHALVVLLAIGVTAACVGLAQRALVLGPLRARMLALPILFAFLLIPGGDFGQREHLLAIVLLPYLVILAGDPMRIGRSTRLAVGAAAGVVIALKPYFGLYLIVGEAMLLLRQRPPRLVLRADAAAIVAVVAAVVLATVIVFPEYLGFIVPLGREIYHGYEMPVLAVITAPEILLSSMMCLLALLLAVRNAAGASRDLVCVLAAFAAAAIAIFGLQRKGWPYQVLPALVFAAIALGVSLTDRLVAYVARRGRTGRAIAAATLAVVLPGALLASLSFAISAHRATEVRPLVDLVAHATPRRALFLSSHLLYAYPVVNYAGASWPYHYHHLLPLPGLYRDYDPAAVGRPFRTPEEMNPTEARFFATMVEDVLQYPPQLILVDRNPQYAPLDDLGFDFIAYFRQDQRFAHVMDGFRYAGRISNHDIYVRREELAGR
jgi:hypothetical protein